MADKKPKKSISPKSAYWNARRAGKTHEQAFEAGRRAIEKNKKKKES